MIYDYVIVGGGPTGLTLALYLSKFGSVILIEKEKYLGGCHGVKYVNGLFTEHGPRMYFDSFVNFISVLNDMNLSFDDYFVPHSLTLVSEISGFLENLSIKDLIELTLMFVYPYNITLDKYCKKFSPKGYRYIDYICRKIDGAGIDRFTTHKFINSINHSLFYKSYQPKYPLDRLFAVWRKKLEQNKVVILTQTEVIDFTKKSVITKTEQILGKNIILAIPPLSLVNLVKKSSLPDSFGSLNRLTKWEKQSRYNRYISIVYHWDKKIEVKYQNESKVTPWGVMYVVLPFTNPASGGTIISTAISFIPKDIDRYSDNEIIEEVFAQLPLRVPKYTHALISDMRHSAFVSTLNGYLTEQKYSNIHACGVYIGESDFNVTSIESAVTNAIALANKISPLNKSIKKRYTLFDIIIVLLIILIIYLWMIS